MKNSQEKERKISMKSRQIERLVEEMHGKEIESETKVENIIEENEKLSKSEEPIINSKTDNLKNKEEIIDEIIDEKKEELKNSNLLEEKKNRNKSLKNKTSVIDEKKETINKTLIIPFILLGFLSFAAYLIYEIIFGGGILNILPILIGNSLIFLFILCFMVIGLHGNNKKVTPFIIIGSIILILYSIFNIAYKTKLISLPTEGRVANFYNQTITKAISWGKANNINIEKVYEYSDIIPEYNIISQNIEVGTLTSKISKITLIISKGPDYNKEIIIPNFIGWNFDTVVKYIESNYLNNVSIDFIESTKTPNTVVNQSASGSLKRNSLINLEFSIDEITPIKIIDLKNKSFLYGTAWLKQHGFKYEIKEEYDEKIKKNYIISQSSKNETKDPSVDTITLTISKGKMIVLPDINKMNQEELNKWIIENNLKVSYEEVYNESIPFGDIIDTSFDKGNILETGDTIKVTISKGKLEMIKLTTIDDFTIWAGENKVNYELQYEYSGNVKKDDIIKASHSTGQLIKTDDTVIIYVSKGKSIIIPSFVGLSKGTISSKCQELNLSCSFTYSGYTENTKRDIATKQSKASGTTVSEGTNIVISLSSGVYEKVTIPSFIGKTKSSISSSCNSIGLKCSFVYESSFSSKAKDIATKQSKTGVVNKGTSLTITLSKGPARAYTVVIDPNQLTAGNANASKSTLQSKLSSACPGVTFTYILQPANSAIGYLAENSQVKIGQNTFTEGNTYKVIINSN